MDEEPTASSDSAEESVFGADGGLKPADVKALSNTDSYRSASGEWNEAQRTLDSVHTYGALIDSMDYCLRLLSLLPEFNRVQQTEKCLTEQIELQKSIRQRSFDDINRVSKTRLMLAQFVGFGSFVVFVISLVYAFMSGADVEKLKVLLTFAGGNVAASLATVLTFYFGKKP